MPLSQRTAANDVWVDFISDFHDGANGPANGIADWIDELDELTSQVSGVADFSPTERTTIENNILANLNAIYADYDLSFVTTEPLGEHDVIYMARDNDHPNVSDTNRGSASSDVGNQDTNGYTTVGGNPARVPRVTTANFDSHLESSDSREQQIFEISTALAGTAAHELGHSFGLLHHYPYSHPGITPDNYDDTGGLQNEYIMGTGNTGISESERETLRELSPFSRVMMDITGGSDASPSEENNSLVVGGIVSDRTENEGGDAGDSLASAWELSFATGPTSGREISFIEADLDGSSSDVDIYQFTTDVAATLVAHVFSERLDLGSSEFDPILELMNSTGEVLSSVDDIGWDDDQYDDLISPEDKEDDPFLVNLQLDPGSYYLRILPTTVDVSDSPNPGDNYWLVTALTLEESFDPGDFDEDGNIDGADFLRWQLDADSNPDSVDDLVDWQTNYGAPPGLGAAQTVPEPSAVVFLAASLMAWAIRRRI